MSRAVARPYARAMFEYACENKSLALWTELLATLAAMVKDEAGQCFFANPASTPAEQIDLLMSPFPKKSNAHEALASFINLIVEQGRVLVLPIVFELFLALCAEHEKTLVVQVRSFSALTAAQEKALVKRLSERLQRQVSLEVSLDSALLGGAVIQAGDLVIDGSVHGKLRTLYTELIA